MLMVQVRFQVHLLTPALGRLRVAMRCCLNDRRLGTRGGWQRRRLAWGPKSAA